MDYSNLLYRKLPNTVAYASISPETRDYIETQIDISLPGFLETRPSADLFLERVFQVVPNNVLDEFRERVKEDAKQRLANKAMADIERLYWADRLPTHPYHRRRILDVFSRHLKKQIHERLVGDLIYLSLDVRVNNIPENPEFVFLEED